MEGMNAKDKSIALPPYHPLFHLHKANKEESVKLLANEIGISEQLHIQYECK